MTGVWGFVMLRVFVCVCVCSCVGVCVCAILKGWENQQPGPPWTQLDSRAEKAPAAAASDASIKIITDRQCIASSPGLHVAECLQLPCRCCLLTRLFVFCSTRDCLACAGWRAQQRRLVT